jgi:diaminopimelate decarboxylase
MDGEELIEAVPACKQHGLPLNGLHFHLGSQFHDPAPLKPSIELALDFEKQIGFSGKWHFSPGGGWGVAYYEDELPQPAIESYIELIAETIVETFQQLELEHAAPAHRAKTQHRGAGRSGGLSSQYSQAAGRANLIAGGRRLG